MAGVATHRHITALCGAILTIRGTTGIGICATTLITGAMAIMLAIIHTTTATITRIIQPIRHTIILQSRAWAIGITQQSVVTRHRAMACQHRPQELMAEQRQPLEVVALHRRA